MCFFTPGDSTCLEVFFIVYLESLFAMKQLSNDQKTKLVQFYWSPARLVQWKAHFHLPGQVNTQNCRVWASNAPDIVLEAPPLRPRVTVWCAMSSTGIIGPFFFEDADGYTLTVNKERYSTPWSVSGSHCRGVRQELTGYGSSRMGRPRIRREWPCGGWKSGLGQGSSAAGRIHHGQHTLQT